MSDFNHVSEVLKNIFSQFSPEMDNSIKMIKEWEKILLSIKEFNRKEGQSSIGEFLAAHSRIVDLKNGVLLIETDHPGWTQKLQFHKKYIMTCLKKAFPLLEINALAFRLKGENINLSKYDVKNNTEEENMQNSATKEEIDEYIKNNKKQRESYPEELRKVLENLEKTVLTKNQ